MACSLSFAVKPSATLHHNSGSQYPRGRTNCRDVSNLQMALPNVAQRKEDIADRQKVLANLLGLKRAYISSDYSNSSPVMHLRGSGKDGARRSGPYQLHIAECSFHCHSALSSSSPAALLFFFLLVFLRETTSTAQPPARQLGSHCFHHQAIPSGILSQVICDCRAGMQSRTDASQQRPKRPSCPCQCIAGRSH